MVDELKDEDLVMMKYCSNSEIRDKEEMIRNILYQEVGVMKRIYLFF